jgi:hypothetical protein
MESLTVRWTIHVGGWLSTRRTVQIWVVRGRIAQRSDVIAADSDLVYDIHDMGGNQSTPKITAQDRAILEYVL